MAQASSQHHTRFQVESIVILFSYQSLLETGWCSQSQGQACTACPPDLGGDPVEMDEDLLVVAVSLAREVVAGVTDVVHLVVVAARANSETRRVQIESKLFLISIKN